jgi:enoyl-CoA hydratase/carnithine racemase
MSFVDLRLDGHVATVTLNRPQALNAISGEVADELAGALLQAAANPDAWVVVLAAAGEREFCVGADLKERNRLDDAGWLRNRMQMRGLFDTLRSLPQPSVASVFGHALGGGFELALSCDLIVAADDAVFGLPEVRVGIIPGGGGTQLLARKIGMARAKELILTARRIAAAEAHAMGLVTEVVPAGGHLERALAIAEGLARFPQDTMLADRRAAIEGLGRTLDEGLELEAGSGAATLETAVRGARRFAQGEGRGGAGAGV